MRRLIIFAVGLQLLLVALAVGQVQMTQISALSAGDSVKNYQFRTVEYLPSGVIWLAGAPITALYKGDNYVFLSTDNGTTWVKRLVYTNAALASSGISMITAKDANTAFLALTTGEILRTTNAGVKWDTVTSYSTPDVAFADGVKYVGQDTLVAYGDAADAQGVFLTRSVDGGKTWTRFTNFPNDSLKTDGIYAGYVSYGGAMESFGRTAWISLYNTANDPPSFLKTTDGGGTWSWFRVTLPGGPALNYYMRSVTFKDANTGFVVSKRAYVNASTNDNYLTKTTDGGKTWSDTICVEPGKAHADAKPTTARAIRGTNTVVATGYGASGSKAWISYDNGTTWTPLNPPSPSSASDLKNVAFGSSTQGIMVGLQNVVKITLGGAATDSVNVTFWANTATVPDTLKSNSMVQIRGAAALFGPWSADSKAILSNVAGDYWKGTYKLKVGDTIQYKFFTNANKPLLSPAGDQGGWEQNSTDPSGNRIIIVGPKDTTLPLQFVNGTPVNQAQFFTPYPNQKDSIEVWFRINMSGQESFNKATQYLGVRGGFTGTPYDGWGKSVVLTKETQHGNGGSRQYDGTNFWSGYVRVPKSTFATNIEYKFVIMDAPSPTANILSWEDGIKAAPDVSSGGNRLVLASPGISDTTMYWKWWINSPAVPFKGQDTVIVTFRANLSRALAERGFAFGDTLQVRSGYGGTAKEVRTKAMTRSGLTGTLFIATDTIIAAVGKQVNYQYYLVKGGTDIREDFYDFDWTGDISQAERRKLNVTTKTLTGNDTTSVSTDMRRMPRFPNTSRLTKPVNVTWTVDVRPAIYTVKSGKKLVSTNITPYVIGNVDSIKIWGVWMNGPAVGGWDVRGGWGPARRLDSLSKMYDDGTHGDVVKGDSVYSLKWRYTTSDIVGQVFKFGIGALDNEGGFGNNHIENVSDADTVFTIASQFGSIDPKFFNSWDFDLKKPKTPTAVEDNWSVPMMYELSQNYPNPFNPSTTIQFTIPTQDVVTLKVFNVLGQEMMTILNQKMDAGKHTVRFDASKLTSGVYLYQVSAGKFVETKKMVLLK